MDAEAADSGDRAPEPILAAELTKDEYARLAGERVFVLPMGILEEHGPHLPLGTDSFQVEAVVHAAAAETGAVVLPTLWYGNCNSTQPFPGSISITFDTLRAVVGDILDELERHDVERVAIVSGHAGGGHMRATKLAAQERAESGGMRIALLSEWDILYGLGPEALGELGIPPGDGHAGTMETARILHLRPELVKDPPGLHEVEEEAHIVPEDPAAIWPDGYGGDPSAASDKIGQRLHDEAVSGLVELFERL